MCDKHEKEETHQMRLLLLVVAWHYQLVYLLAERSPQERHDLRSRAGVLRQEAVVVTLEHTRVDRPAHRLECIGGCLLYTSPSPRD